jgi:hypothetical protein
MIGAIEVSGVSSSNGSDSAAAEGVHPRYLQKSAEVKENNGFAQLRKIEECGTC